VIIILTIEEYPVSVIAKKLAPLSWSF